MKHDISEIKRKANLAMQESLTNRRFYEDIFEYLLPYGNPYHKAAGFSGNYRQYDSYPAIVADSFVETMLGFTPQDSTWLHLQPGTMLDFVLKQNENINPDAIPEFKKRWLEHLESETELLHGYRLNSNFYMEIADFFFNLGFGTAVMMIDSTGDVSNPIAYKNIPLTEIALSEDSYGIVDGFFREYKMKISSFKRQFPDASLSEVINRKDDDEISLLSAYVRIDSGGWKHLILLNNATEIYTQEFDVQPFLVVRWRKSANGTHGIGPFVTALPDIRTMNRKTQLNLQAEALAVMNPLLVKSSMSLRSNVTKVAPGQPLVVDSNLRDNPDITPLKIGMVPPTSELAHRKLQDSLKKIMLDGKLPAESQPVRSVTELTLRIKENQVKIGTAYYRLLKEFIIPLANRERNILSKVNILQVPEDLSEISGLVDGKTITAIPTSPLAKQQKIGELQEIVQWARIVSEIAPQEFAMLFDTKKLTEKISELANFPAEMWRSAEEKQRLLHNARQLQRESYAQQGEAMQSQQGKAMQ